MTKEKDIVSLFLVILISSLNVAIASPGNVPRGRALGWYKNQEIFTESAYSTNILVNPENTYVDLVGKNFSVDVDVTDANETWAFEFKMNWTASVLNVTNVINGSFLSQGGELYCAQDIYYDEGWLRFGCTLLEPATNQSGSGTLATLNFTTLDEGNITLHLYDTYLLNDNLDNYTHNTTDGYVLVNNPPVVTIQSPKNGKTYSSSSVDLTFSVNEPTSWCAYSLDGGVNETLDPCVGKTLTGLSDGPHNVTVYARDIIGNEGYSDSEFYVYITPPPGFPIGGGGTPMFEHL